MKAGKKVYFLEVGCPARVMESSRIRTYFQVNGHEIVTRPESADYIIFSTCALENDLKKVCHQTIIKLMTYPAKLIVTGCFPAVADVKRYDQRKVRFLAVKHIDKLDDIFKEFKIKFELLPEKNFVETGAASDEGVRHERSIAILRIGVGCDEYCTYCVTRLAVGGIKSKPLGVCLAEYKGLLEKGYRYFKILGEDVGAYGVDTGSSILELLEEMSSIDPHYIKKPHDTVKLMITNFNPYWSVKYSEALKGVLKNGKIVSLSCPIQSGSDRILRLMGRRYKIKDVERALLGFREVSPALRLFTHIIVGFPTETHDDLMRSLAVIKRIVFSGVEVMPYSDHRETPAYKLSHKVDAALILKRKHFAEYFLASNGFKHNNNTPRAITLQHLVNSITR